jgi:superfamily II DNA/RNA helicase
VFTASVEHAKHVALLFKDAGIRATFASGETPTAEREAIVAGFRGSTIDVLVNCGLYLEGFDVPSVEVIINARPTKSTTLYTQITGRGVRPLDEDAFFLSQLPTKEARVTAIKLSRKPYATIVDIVDRARRHQLVTLPTLWDLPAQIDAQGNLISELADEYEELFRKAPREAARARSAESIRSALADIEEASGKPRQAAAWQMITPEHWRLERPAERTARDRKGRVISNFAQKFERFVGMAKKIAPHEDAEAFAFRTLNVDRRSVVVEALSVEVTCRGDQWVAESKKGKARARILVSAPSLPDAIAAATARLEAGENRAQAPAGIKRRGTRRWRGRKKGAAPKQAAQAM